MNYEEELDEQIRALEEQIEKKKSYQKFWLKNLPSYEDLMKKWDPMVQYIMSSKRVDVAMNLEVMSILTKKYGVVDINLFIIPILGRMDENGKGYGMNEI